MLRSSMSSDMVLEGHRSLQKYLIDYTHDVTSIYSFFLPHWTLLNLRKTTFLDWRKGDEKDTRKFKFSDAIVNLSEDIWADVFCFAWVHMIQTINATDNPYFVARF